MVVADAFALTNHERLELTQRVTTKKAYKGRADDVFLPATAGLMRLDGTAHFPRLLFTPEGLAALRRMMADPRLADPEKFAHIRRELGIDPGHGAEADGQTGAAGFGGCAKS
jgi:hypothetical protein